MIKKNKGLSKRCLYIFDIVSIALIVSIGLIGVVSAENVQSVLPMVDGTVRDGLDSPKDGVADDIIDGSIVQVLDVERPSMPFEDRGIIEFDVSTLSGTITSANLDLNVFGSNGPYPFKVDVFTYSGDGILSLNDFNAGTPFYTFEYSGESTVQLDVTPFIKSIVDSGDPYAGFNFQFAEPSPIPMNGPFVAFNSIEFPPAAILTIRVKPSVSISTDKSTYAPGETMTVTLNIENPTSNPVDLEWYIGVPQSNKWVTKAKASIPVGYNKTHTIPMPVSNWGPSPFGLVHYVQLLNPTTKDVLAQNAAVFAYSPIATSGPQVDIAEELMKQRVKLPN